MDIAESVEQFRTHISPDAYAGARYAVVAFERYGALHNLCSRVTWHPIRVPAPTIRALGQKLVIASGWLSLKQSMQLLNDLPEGQTKLAEFSVTFRDVEHDRPYGYAWEHSEVMWSQPSIGWSAHCLLLNGLQMGSLLRDTRMAWLGDRLISLRPDRVMSWRDVERIVGPKCEIVESRACTIELFAPLWVRLLEPHLDQEGVTLTVQVESFLDPVTSDMELVVQESAMGSVIDVIPAKRWIAGTRRMWKVTLPCTAIRGPVDLWLNAGNLKVWRSTVSLPGLSARLLHGIDGGFVWLEKLLLPSVGPKTDAVGFERAVVSLLALRPARTSRAVADGRRLLCTRRGTAVRLARAWLQHQRQAHSAPATRD